MIEYCDIMEVSQMPEQPTTPPKIFEFNPQNIDPNLLDQVISVYEGGYGKKWIGRERFMEETLPNTTVIDALMVNGKVAGAVNINNNRIITISINPEFQGLGLGTELFRQVADLHPDIWISIGVDAKEMLATITNGGLNFQLVEDPGKIKNLYKTLKGVNSDFSIETVEVEDPFLAQRFAKKGIKKDKFTAFVRSGSLHDSSYKQLLFQNQS